MRGQIYSIEETLSFSFARKRTLIAAGRAQTTMLLEFVKAFEFINVKE